jgi:hypothetical protein
MERIGGSATVAVEEVKSALTKAKTLTSEEEKVLRMRHGAGLSQSRGPLSRAAGSNEELADELLLIEMQLLRAHRAQQAKAIARVTGVRNSAKDKIIRGLRKKQ